MSNATVRRAFFGAYVKQGREQAGMSPLDAAKVLVGPDASARQLETAVSQLNKVENGKIGLKPDKAQRLFTGYRVYTAEEIEWLVQLGKTRADRGRWSGHRAVVPTPQRVYYDFEEESSAVNQYLTEVVPGLLQIEAYMRAELLTNPRSRTGRFLDQARDRFGDKSVDDLIELWMEDVVATRLERQRRVLDAADFHFVLSESCLKRVYGGNAVMSAQMAHLIGLSHRPNVRIQILPFSAPASSIAFTGLRVKGLRSNDAPLELVYLENLHDADYVDAPGPVEDYHDLWKHLTTGALARDESRRLILQYAGEYS